ncbi:ribosomal protein S18 acetylase RimI-like enzyme [Fictibacillus halophilus]|uniref:Ribosomal protein S18 acetylase RimI-like enzyme n=1 Tax=Fictibacillus halophilus TaxID=1610490 RepID=A0ABV2LKX4_9BACL|nr:GNAT family N-acetyltransferase [Fictibacillus halophilus]
MKSLNVNIITYLAEFAEQTVKMWRDSKFEAIGVKESHSFESHVYFLNNILTKEFVVELAMVDAKVVGMIAYNQTEISQLYVHRGYQKAGIGNALLQRAKDHSSGRIALYTFEVNKKAQRFYEKNGFKIIGRGHENEENLPDIQYEWRANKE